VGAAQLVEAVLCQRFDQIALEVLR